MGLLQGMDLLLFAHEVESRIQRMLDQDGEATIHNTVLRDVLRARIDGPADDKLKYAAALVGFMQEYRLVGMLRGEQIQFRRIQKP